MCGLADSTHERGRGVWAARAGRLDEPATRVGESVGLPPRRRRRGKSSPEPLRPTDHDGQATLKYGVRDSGHLRQRGRAPASSTSPGASRMSGDLTYGVPFAGRHIGPSQDEQRRMLDLIGYGSIEELMDAAIPEVIRWHGTLDLPPAASEAEVLAELRELADRNTVATSMIGLGYYGTI